MATIFGTGLAVRVGLIFLSLHSLNAAAEPVYIAVSLAKNGTYADAYGPGVGPTAHTSPLLPLILSIVIRVFGTGLAGQLVRSILASIAACMAFALLPALAVKCQLGMWPGVAAGLVGAIAPINYWPQTVGIFDAPYTMLGLTGLCVVLSGYWIGESFPLRGGIFMGVLSGVLCLLNPTILQALVGWSILGMLRFDKNRWAYFKFMATVVLIIVLFLSPWAFRNSRTLGGAIWTRSNFGLELQVSNYDNATADEGKNDRSPNFPHPFVQLKERQKVREMGELAYMQAKRREAVWWIYNHPSRFIQLAAQRIFLFWFPQMARWWQSIAEGMITLLAIAGLLRLFKKHHPSSWMFLAVVLFYPAVYLVIEVSPRYRCPIEPILFLLGCLFCRDLWNAFGANWPSRKIVNLDLESLSGDHIRIEDTTLESESPEGRLPESTLPVFHWCATEVETVSTSVSMVKNDVPPRKSAILCLREMA
jgi:hypothetical protein